DTKGTPQDTIVFNLCVKCVKNKSATSETTLPEELYENLIDIVKKSNGKRVAKVVNSRIDSGGRNVFRYPHLKDKVKMSLIKNHFIFSVESTGALPAHQLVTEAVEILIGNGERMGRIFLEHIGGHRLFSCASCDTVLTNRHELISTRFTGATGRAFLFNRVVNLNYSEVQDRVMLTGRHMVRDVSCKNCDTKLGWIYEFATEENQRYKEGKVILERALVTESDGLEEHLPNE
ncbi:unnamed protein product, partial [Medioppia subpectinata]